MQRDEKKKKIIHCLQFFSTKIKPFKETMHYHNIPSVYKYTDTIREINKKYLGRRKTKGLPESMQ
jgi:hypothetical protein